MVIVLTLVAFGLARLNDVSVVAAAVSSAPFAHQFRAGESFEYKRDLEHRGATTHRDSSTVRFVITNSVAGHAEGVESVFGSGGRTLTPLQVLIAEGGSWRTQGGAWIHNFITLDPSLYCQPPANLSIGTKWSCDVAVSGTAAGATGFPSGRETVEVLATTGDGVKLHVRGVSPQFRKNYFDPDTKQTVASTTAATWSEDLVLSGGIIQTSRRTTNVQTTIANLNLSQQDTVTLRLVSHSP